MLVTATQPALPPNWTASTNAASTNSATLRYLGFGSPAQPEGQTGLTPKTKLLLLLNHAALHFQVALRFQAGDMLAHRL
jgi:hypothetical protein